MNDEIREILEQLEWYRKIGKKDVYYPECVLSNKKAFILLDYITNLKEENEDYKSKFDKVAKILNANTHVENIYHALCNLFDETYQYEIDNEELLNILQNGSEK